MVSRAVEFIRRHGHWILFCAVITADLAIRRSFFIGAPVNRIAAYPASVLFEALLFWLSLRFLSRFSRVRRAFLAGALAAAYGFAVIGSWGMYFYFNNLPGVFTFSYLLEETGDFLKMAAGEFSWALVAGVAGFAALTFFASRSRLGQPARALSFKARVAVVIALVALGLVLDKTVGVTSGFAMPFSDALFSFKYAAVHNFKGQRSYLRLQGRVVVDKPKPVNAEAPYNALIIFNESVRRKNLSAFGYERDTMPLLSARFRSWGDRLFTFPNAYSNGTVTTITTASFLTGRLTVERLSELERASASYEEFKRFDNTRAAYLSSHNFHPGNFKEFVASPALDAYAYTEKMNWPATWSGGSDDRNVVETFGGFLGGVAPAEKFFAILHMSNTHYPYLSPEGERPFGEATIPDRYDNSLRYLDKNLDAIFTALEKSGRAEDTLIFLTSDHGEAIKDEAGGQKGHLGRFSRVTANVPFFVVVPKGFFQKHPEALANIKANTSQNVQNADVAPTLADALGLPGLERYPGASLLKPLPEGRMFFIFNGLQKGIDMDYLAAVRGPDFALLGLGEGKEFKAWRIDGEDRPGPLDAAYAREIAEKMTPYPLLSGFRKKLLELAGGKPN